MKQSEEILAYLKKGRKLTALEALQKFSCFRLAARINELRKTHHIMSESVRESDKTFARYWIEKEGTFPEESTKCHIDESIRFHSNDPNATNYHPVNGQTELW